MPSSICIHTQVTDGSKDLKFQQVNDVLYVPVHLQPLELQVMWLKKINCENKFPRKSSKQPNELCIVPL